MIKTREYLIYEHHFNNSQNSEKESEDNTIQQLQSTGLNDASEATSEANRSNEIRVVQ